MSGGLMQLIANGSQNIHDTDRKYLTQDIYDTNIRYQTKHIDKYQTKHFNITIEKVINLNKNSECPVSYIKFEDNCLYYTCNVCEYNIDADTLKQWIKNNKTCPMCRSEWNNYTIFINK